MAVASPIGAFAFVLHTHLPYARLAGRWPHGEEWLHEAAAESYIPLLETLYDLHERGINVRLTIGLTPVLAEQLVDPLVRDHFDQYLDQRIEAAERDIAYFEAPETAHGHLRYLAEIYRDSYRRTKRAFHERFNRDLIGAFRNLREAGVIELMTSAASHAYLPLLSRDSTIQGQIKTALRAHQRLFGHRPTTFWLPECGYRPAYITEDGKLRPGLEHFLAQHGLTIFFTESHTITGGAPVGVAAGDVVGPYGEIRRRYVIPQEQTPHPPPRQATTFLPYYVIQSDEYPGSGRHSGVAVIGRNNIAGQQVWSADWGYPGDYDYREFHRKSPTSGLQYWRITNKTAELAEKDLYHPDWAKYKVEQHAEHFAHLIGDQLRRFASETGKFGILSANFDTELLGHWWYEGIDWLRQVLEHLNRSTEIAMMTASDFLAAHPPEETLSLPEGSWGAGGTHFVWDNNETHWMWAPIHDAEERLELLASHYTNPTADERIVLNQLAREALLLQCSDWPFLVTTGQAREYAVQRFNQHLERFNRLAASLNAKAPDTALAAELWELDKVFPDIDYRDFAAVS